MVQEAVAKEYSGLKTSLGLSDDEFINYLKAKLIRDFDGKHLITNL